jgi:acyl carrier protein
MNNIEQQIKKIVSEQLGVPADKIENHHAFIQDLGGDSLDTVEMVLTLEDQFNIEIQEEEAEEMTTVERAISYVTNRLKQAA